MERIGKRWLLIWLLFVAVIVVLVATLEATGFFEH